MPQKRKDQNLLGHADRPVYSQSVLSTSSTLAWLYVSALCCSYWLCAALLHKASPVDAGLWASFTEQVPRSVFQWQLAAFGGVLLLNIINLVFCSTPVQYNCNVLLVLIHTVAFATDSLIEQQATSLVVAWSGRMFLPLRYIQWCHTTPTMILLMSMMTDLPGWRVYAAVAGDLVMVVTGLVASWTAGPLQYISLTASFTGFAVVLSAIVDMFRGAQAEAGADATSRLLLGRMLGLTLLVWSLFPFVWLSAHCGLLSLTMEQVLWGVSDYGAKVVFSSHLWQKNLATVQQRREAAQELMGALDRGLLLERVRGLAASKERLVYALSHELRAPINGMLALVQELLYNKTQSAASRTKMLMMIRSSATCLLNTIDTTLNGSGSGAAALNGPAQCRPHKVQLWRVCESVLRLTRPMVKEHVRLINCISKDMPPVKGDSTRLMQVLMNLVCTCLKFTHAGDIKVSASQTHSAASVVVADTGQGIPPEQLAQALRPFEQDGADVWDVCRSGLGLFLVQQALSSMGSSIQASSELGKGSSFRFDLSLADSECESESEMETDMFSEAGSLRASLELTAGDYDSARGRGVLSSDSQSGGSKRPSTDLLLTPAAVAAGPRASYLNSSSLAGTGTGSSTAASSIASGVDHDGMAAAAAAGFAVAAGGSHTGKSGQLPQPSTGDSATTKLVPSDSSSPTALGLLPPKPCHRYARDGKIQVLSVDDDPVNQLVASAALRSHKWEVVKCMSGAEALEYLERSCSVLPDLVLLDVMMPSMSGYDVAARLRQSYPSSLLPIIMVSAKTEEDDIVQGLRCGADDYITKPFKHAELAARIRAHIRARDAFAQQQAAEQSWLLQHNLLPPNVQRKLRAGETVVAESHPCATVLWAELVGGLAGNVGAAPHEQQFAGAAGAAGVVAKTSNSSNSSSTAAGADCEATHPNQQCNEDHAPAAVEAVANVHVSNVGDGGADDSNVDDAALAPRSSGGLSPAEAVVTLNSLYTTWEELCAQRDVLGVDFSGNTFVAVSGHDDNPQHLRHMLTTAEAMLGVAAAMAAQHHQGSNLGLAVRLGLHTGPITTGLVGSKAVKLVLMGNTVEGARQLASSGSSSGLHISADVYNALGGSSGAAAAAMLWTLQTLPGEQVRQHTYLLPSVACAAAGGSSSGKGQQQVRPAAAQDGTSSNVGLQYLVPSAAPITGGACTDSSAGSLCTKDTAAAVSPSAAPGLSSSSGSGQTSAAASAVHEVSVGRLARFLRPAAAGKAAAAAAAAAAAGSLPLAAHSMNSKSAKHTVQDVGSQAQQQQQLAAAAVSLTAASNVLSDNHAAAQPATAGAAKAALHGGSSSSSSRPSGTAVISAALPAPAPGGSVGFGGNRSSNVSRSSRDGRLATTSPPALAAVGLSLAYATSADARALGMVADDGADVWPGTHNSHTASDIQQQQQLVRTSSNSNAATTSSGSSSALQVTAAALAAAVDAQTATTTLCTNQASLLHESSAQPLVRTASVGSAREHLSPGWWPPSPRPGSSAQQQQWQQQLQAGSAALLLQLGEERQRLQQQLLQSTQQCAAATAELSCVKQQLADALNQNATQAAVVDSLRQQLGSAVMKTHLADCWRTLASMKVQFNSLMITGQGPPLQQQQQLQQQQTLLQQFAALAGAGSPAAVPAGIAASQQQLLQLQQFQQQQLLLSAAAATHGAVPVTPVAPGVSSATRVAPDSRGQVTSSSATSPNTAASATDATPADALFIQQQAGEQSMHWTVLQQQQQLMALAALQQQQPGSLLALQQLQQQVQSALNIQPSVAAAAAGSSSMSAAAAAMPLHAAPVGSSLSSPRQD